MKEVIRFVLDILLIACIVMSVFFGYKVYQRYREDRNNKETYQKIQTYAKKDIDWNKLRKINPDIVGWIKIKDTKINYPVVKGKTNRTYLHTDFNKKYNYGGCIFLDYHDHKDLNKNQHSIIYGHHMRNGSMFADLTKFRKENFAKKHLIILYTPQKTYYLKAFSIYAKNADSEIPITFKDKNDKQVYIDRLLNRNSVPDISKRADVGKNIFTFATCSYEGDDYRTYVHCVEK